MKRIGITGGIGVGKSTVSDIFHTLGIPIYNADIEAKRIMLTNRAVKKKIKDLLGNEAYHRNGKLNKNYIGSKIFSNKDLLEEINAIVHPAVHDDSMRWMELMGRDENVVYVIKESAILVETNTHKALDEVIVVTCPDDIRIQRVMIRDRLPYKEVIKKVESQMSQEEKVKYANYIIKNDGETSLIKQVWETHRLILASADN